MPYCDICEGNVRGPLASHNETKAHLDELQDWKDMMWYAPGTFSKRGGGADWKPFHWEFMVAHRRPVTQGISFWELMQHWNKDELHDIAKTLGVKTTLKERAFKVAVWQLINAKAKDLEALRDRPPGKPSVVPPFTSEEVEENAAPRKTKRQLSRKKVAVPSPDSSEDSDGVPEECREYCGRKYCAPKKCKCGECNGMCGPRNGCQCSDCETKTAENIMRFTTPQQQKSVEASEASCEEIEEDAASETSSSDCQESRAARKRTRPPPATKCFRKKETPCAPMDKKEHTDTVPQVRRQVAAECKICSEAFGSKNGGHKKCTCPYCADEYCQSCICQWLLASIEEPRCMNDECMKPWSQEFIDSCVYKVWRNQEYKEHRSKVLFDREKALLPATQPMAESRAKDRRTKQEISQIEAELDTLSATFNRLRKQRRKRHGPRHAVDGTDSEGWSEDDDVPNDNGGDGSDVKGSFLCRHRACTRLRRRQRRACPSFHVGDQVWTRLDTGEFWPAELIDSLMIQGVPVHQEVAKGHLIAKAYGSQVLVVAPAAEFLPLEFQSEKTHPPHIHGALAKAQQENAQEDEEDTIGEIVETYRVLSKRLEALRNPANVPAQPEEERERKKFIRRCPAPNCRGFLSSGWKCGICAMFSCPECQEVKGASRDVAHTCDPGALATARLIAHDTKACPKCGELITKIDGCDQMFCVMCHTAFSWITGKVITGMVHNPHYFEWQQRNGGNQAPQAAGPQIQGACGQQMQWGDFKRQLTRNGTLEETEWMGIIELAFRRVGHVSDIDMRRLTNPNIPNDPATNEEVRIRYLLNEISDAGLMTHLQKIETKQRREIELWRIYETLTGAAADIFHRMSTNAGEEEAMLKLCQELDCLRRFVNVALDVLRRRYDIALKGFTQGFCQNWSRRLVLRVGGDDRDNLTTFGVLVAMMDALESDFATLRATGNVYQIFQGPLGPQLRRVYSAIDDLPQCASERTRRLATTLKDCYSSANNYNLRLEGFPRGENAEEQQRGAARNLAHFHRSKSEWDAHKASLTLTHPRVNKHDGVPLKRERDDADDVRESAKRREVEAERAYEQRKREAAQRAVEARQQEIEKEARERREALARQQEAERERQARVQQEAERVARERREALARQEAAAEIERERRVRAQQEAEIAAWKLKGYTVSFTKQ